MADQETETGRARPGHALHSTDADGKIGREATAAANRVADAGTKAIDATAKSARDAATTMTEGATDEIKQTLGAWTQQGEELADRSRQSLLNFADYGGVVMQGMTDISRAWLELAHGRMQRRAENLTALARCRTPEDFLGAQTRLLHDNLEQTLDINRRVTEVSMNMMGAAAEKMTNAVRAPIAA